MTNHQEERVLLRATLAFLRQSGQVLLPLKKEKIGAGCRNGYGGGIEADESPKAATVRELGEESGLKATPGDVQPVAVVDFHNAKSDGGVFTCRVYVSFIDRWHGVPCETREMGSPDWFPVVDTPVDDMMIADRDWFLAVLAGRIIYAQAWYGPRQQTLLRPTEVTDITKEELDRLWHT